MNQNHILGTGRVLTCLGVASLLLIGLAARASQTSPPDPSKEINKPFQNPVAKDFVAKFETESREVYAQRAAIVEATGVRAGMTVADFGAGTGLFTQLFADKVGLTGRIYAVDVAAPFLAHIDAESKRLGHPQVRTVKATQDLVGLAPQSVDLVFLCDTYHHLEQPAKALEGILKALRLGGRLVVIDFDREKNPTSDFMRKHVRFDKAGFVAEVKAAGFEEVPTPDVPGLKENFLLKFRRTGDLAPAPLGPVGLRDRAVAGLGDAG